MSIKTIQGDITKIDSVEAIVNAANHSLLGGGGVDGAIHRAAGKGLLEECRKLNGCETGEAKITGAYNLSCKYVIHTVGPVWHGGTHNEPQLLADCYKNSLKVAIDHGIKTIAFPSISTGVYSYPLQQAADIAVNTVNEFVNNHPDSFDEIVWVLFDAKTKAAYDNALASLPEKDVPELESPTKANTEKHMIGFFHENEEYGCFSNWYPAAFEYAGKHYANSEQFMMYHKVMMFHKYDLADQIMRTTDPYKCKKIAGQKFPEFDSDLWEKTCVTIVKRGVKAKFAQNEDILQILLGTGNTLLAECSPYDKKWGIGIDINDPDHTVIAKWRGKNFLGRILMEVREEIRQEMYASSGKELKYINACDLDPIPEWNMTAGELKRIPQFYNAIHAYSDTLKSYHEKDAFYNKGTLYEWEIAMRTNMGGGLPAIGFYEMKQDIYDTVRRLQLLDVKKEKRLSFCEKYIPILQMIDDDPDLKHACEKHSVYTRDKEHPALIAYLYEHFMKEAYASDIVIHNYREIIEKNSADNWVSRPANDQLEILDSEGILACIAWHFRRDHFVEGSLISESIADGHMLRMLNAYFIKATKY